MCLIVNSPLVIAAALVDAIYNCLIQNLAQTPAAAAVIVLNAVIVDNDVVVAISASLIFVVIFVV